MKKMDLISFIAIVVSIVGLALLKVTGMTGHIVISVVALAIMVACTIVGKKDFKVPALEIAYRVAYFIALVTGIVMIKANIYGPVSIAHKAFAIVFAVLYIVNFVVKAKK